MKNRKRETRNISKRNLPGNPRHNLAPGRIRSGFLRSFLGDRFRGTSRSPAFPRGNMGSRSNRLGVVNLTGRISWESRSRKCIRNRHCGNYLKNLDLVRITFLLVRRGLATSSSRGRIRLRDELFRVRLTSIRGAPVRGPRKQQNFGILIFLLCEPLQDEEKES